MKRRIPFFLIFSLLVALPAPGVISASVTITPRNSDVVSGKRNDVLSIIINIYPYQAQLDKLAPDARIAVLTDIALKQTESAFSKVRFQKLFVSKVEFVSMSKYDEYGRPDPASQKDFGYIRIHKGKDGKTIVSERHLNVTEGKG